jgi:hypothetical protein
MAEPAPIDLEEPTLTLDLERGLVALDESERLVVPVAPLLALAEASGAEAARAFGAAIGASLATRAATRLGEARGASVERALEVLAGEVALVGLGALSIERWGKAVVLVLEPCALSTARAGDHTSGSARVLLEACFEAALVGAFGSEVRSLVLSDDASRVRLLVTSQAARDRARALLAHGAAWQDVLVTLHTSRGEASTEEARS